MAKRGRKKKLEVRSKKLEGERARTGGKQNFGLFGTVNQNTGISEDQERKKTENKKWRVESEKQEADISLAMEKEKEKSYAPEQAMEQPRLMPKKAERRNKLIMWLGIGGIMLALLLVWFFNLKHEFRVSAKKNVGDGVDWSQIRSELDKTVKQVKQGLDQIKQLQKNALNAPSKQAPLTTEQLDALKGRLMGEMATTASSTRK